ncbi:MAG TPA: SpoIIE family protein phosphatase [Candidatus Polarisedimenticolaceae bacterium]
MALSFRARLLWSIGLPLLVVYGAMAWILTTRLERGAVARLERGAIERVGVFAGRLDDRVRIQGAEALASSFAEFDRRVAEAGARYVVIDASGKVVHDSDGRIAEGADLAVSAEAAGRPQVSGAVREALAGRSGIARVEGTLSGDTGWLVHVPLASTGGAVFAGASEATVLADLRSQMRLGLSVLALGLLAILAVVWGMGSHVTRPVSRLALAVRELGRGDLDVRVTGIASRDEIGDLAAAFNRMVADLKHHVEAREKVEGELRAGRTIQTAMLPKSLPTGDGFALAARNLAARHVAGDFYDAFEDRGALVFVVADVSGKGLPSAMYMAVSKAVLRRALLAHASLADAVADTNDALEREAIGSMYLTAFVGRYDAATGRLRYVNAAHPPPWRTGAGETAEVGTTSGGPIGMFPRRRFEEREASLAPGESLVIFSDGVPEARTHDGEFYGEGRLKSFLEHAEAVDAAAVAREVESFQQGILADDVTVMVLRREA